MFVWGSSETAVYWWWVPFGRCHSCWSGNWRPPHMSRSGVCSVDRSGTDCCRHSRESSGSSSQSQSACCLSSIPLDLTNTSSWLTSPEYERTLTQSHKRVWDLLDISTQLLDCRLYWNSNMCSLKKMPDSTRQRREDGYSVLWLMDCHTVV